MQMLHLPPIKYALGAVLFIASLAVIAAPGQPAPPFALSDASGKQVSLSDYQGKPLVLHFWATWCPYCKKLQPGLERLSLKYQDQDLVVLGISFLEDEGVQPQAVLTRRGHTFKTLIDGDDVASDYGVRGTPTTIFVSRHGEIAGITNTSDPDNPVLERLATSILE